MQRLQPESGFFGFDFSFEKDFESRKNGARLSIPTPHLSQPDPRLTPSKLPTFISIPDTKREK
jgi:hypothetical protein